MGKKGTKVPSTSCDTFALLVPVSCAADADGEVISAPEVGTSWVRRFTDQDASRMMKSLPTDELAEFARIEHALEAQRIPEMFAGARNRTMLHYSSPKYKKEKTNLPEEALKVGKHVAALVGLPAEEAFLHLEGKAVGPRAQQNPVRMFAWQVINGFSQAWVVLWLERGFAFPRPAMYCPDQKTALYGHQFVFRAVGGCRWKICRGCEVMFFQKDPRSSYHNKQCGQKTRKSRNRTKLKET